MANYNDYLLKGEKAVSLKPSDNNLLLLNKLYKQLQKSNHVTDIAFISALINIFSIAIKSGDAKRIIPITILIQRLIDEDEE